jgi:hypothetical protein
MTSVVAAAVLGGSFNSSAASDNASSVGTGSYNALGFSVVKE